MGTFNDPCSMFTWHPNKMIIFQSDCCLGRSHWSKEALFQSPRFGSMQAQLRHVEAAEQQRFAREQRRG